MRRLLCAQMITCAAFALPADRIADAIGAMQQGDLPRAETLLQEEIAAQPGDAAALSVLGIVLDQEHKYADAETAYKRALAADGNEPSLLNNYGNHLLSGGHAASARSMFQKAVALDPSNKNANVQLAKLAMDAGHGADALSYLGHLTPADRSAPDIELMTGAALSSSKRYPEAEQVFQRIADAVPGGFQAQYDLGLAASKANHPDVAERALRRALDLKPGDADVLYDLAVVKLKTGKGIEAIALLAQASASHPERADIQLLLAQSTSRLGYFEDSIQAWNKYLALKPADQAGRRERAFAQSAIGQDSEGAMATLVAFTQNHPTDPVGHYELGTALTASDPERAARELSRAIQLDPGLTSAYVARGLLAYRRGDSGAAIRDFSAAAKQQPENARILDRLGETYLATDRVSDALPVLRKASQIAPDDPSVLLHLGRALTKSGQRETAAGIFARYRTVQQSTTNAPHESGLVEFLSLPPGEQQARYRAGVERTVAAQPENAEAQVRYLELLLSDGEKARAAQVCEKILQLRPDEQALAAAGRALLDAEDYSEAATFLAKSIGQTGSVPSLQLELARARAEMLGMLSQSF